MVTILVVVVVALLGLLFGIAGASCYFKKSGNKSAEAEQKY